jgi:hypothetical protein
LTAKIFLLDTSQVHFPPSNKPPLHPLTSSINIIAMSYTAGELEKLLDLYDGQVIEGLGNGDIHKVMMEIEPKIVRRK